MVHVLHQPVHRHETEEFDAACTRKAKAGFWDCARRSDDPCSLPAVQHHLGLKVVFLGELSPSRGSIIVHLRCEARRLPLLTVPRHKLSTRWQGHLCGTGMLGYMSL